MPGSVVCAPRSTRSPPWDGTSTATAMRPTKIMSVSVRGWSFASNIDLPDGLRLAAGRILMEESIHGDHCDRSEEHTSELQSLMRISYAVFCLKTKKTYHYTYMTTHK